MSGLAARIRHNLEHVRERMARAADAAGRPAVQITLVGITKYVGLDAAAALRAAGCEDLGESRPQELWAKAQAAPLRDVRWHLVGHLQRNKIRRTLPLVKLIHSVDSPRLLAAINEEAARIGRIVDVLLEVNCSGETAKHGLEPAELPTVVAAAPNHPNVHIRGLMTMAALEGGTTAAARNFAALRTLRDDIRPDLPAGITLDDLSMGMSADFEIAIREGATIVRVGSLLWKDVDADG